MNHHQATKRSATEQIESGRYKFVRVLESALAESMQSRTAKRQQTIVQSIGSAIKIKYINGLEKAACEMGVIRYLGNKFFNLVVLELLRRGGRSFALTRRDLNQWVADVRPGEERRQLKKTQHPEKNGLLGIIRRSFSSVCKTHRETPCLRVEREVRNNWKLMSNILGLSDEERPNGAGLSGFIDQAANDYYKCLEKHTLTGAFKHLVKYVALKKPEWRDRAEKVAEALWIYLDGGYLDVPKRRLMENGTIPNPILDYRVLDTEVVVFILNEEQLIGCKLKTLCQRLHLMRHILATFEEWNRSLSPLEADQQVKLFSLVPQIDLRVPYITFDKKSIKTWASAYRLPSVNSWSDLFVDGYIERHRKNGWELAGMHRTNGIQAHVLLQRQQQVFINPPKEKKKADGSSVKMMNFEKRGGTLRRPFAGPLDMNHHGLYMEEALDGALATNRLLNITAADPGSVIPLTPALTNRALVNWDQQPLTSADFLKLGEDNVTSLLTKGLYYSELEHLESRGHWPLKKEKADAAKIADDACAAVSFKHSEMTSILNATAVHLRHFLTRRKYHFAPYLRRQQFAKESRIRSMIDRFIQDIAPEGTVVALGNAVNDWRNKGIKSSIAKKVVNGLGKSRAVVLVDEFRTTKLCSKCSWDGGEGVVLQHMKCTHQLPDFQHPERLQRRCHSSITHVTGLGIDLAKLQKKRYQNVRGLLHCPTCDTFWDRDFNAAINIGIRASYLASNKPIPDAFRRRGRRAADLDQFEEEELSSDSDEDDDDLLGDDSGDDGDGGSDDDDVDDGDDDLLLHS